MSARSAQRTRWRRWRMGWDIAGRKDRDGRHEWTQVVGSAQTSAPWPSRFFVFFFSHPLHFVLPTLLFPIYFPFPRPA